MGELAKNQVLTVVYGRNRPLRLMDAGHRRTSDSGGCDTERHERRGEPDRQGWEGLSRGRTAFPETTAEQNRVARDAGSSQQQRIPMSSTRSESFP